MLPYSRTDFAQVGTTNRGCMQVVPGDRKRDILDRIAVGGQNGSVICLARKLNDTQILFKTPPGAEIETLSLGGALGTVKDKIFVASETSVRGINKKGKTFFSFETNMAERAKRMHVYGVELVLTGKKSYNHYHDCSDANYYLCPEDIHDVVSLINEEAWGGRAFTSVLACADSTIKIIEGSLIGYDIKLSDVPFTLCLFKGDGGPTRDLVLYGTKNGRLGLVQVPQNGGCQLWEIATTTMGAISSISCYTILGASCPDIVLGKEDGMVEVYTVNEENQPTLYGNFQCDESITGVSCGNVTSWNDPEVIVCTYTGWLFSLSKTNKIAAEQLPKAANFSVKVQQLRTEVEELESKITEERQRYEEMTRRGNGPAIAFTPNFQIHDSFEYISELGAYNLTIELVIPIDFVIVQSHLPLRLMEVEKNASVVSELARSEFNPWPLLATYRCQANVCRLELRVRCNEGDAGVVNVYVSPKIHPKAAQITSYQIRALSAHVRCHQFDLTRPVTTLSFTGTFSISEAHAWLHQLVPNIPVKCPPADTVTNNFVCAKNGGTQLQVTYSKGSAVFRSDCLTTIVIIRDKVTEETLQKQIRVEVSCDLNESSVVHCLRLIDTKMNHLIGIEKRKMYAMALKELEANTNEDVYTFLSDDNADILRNHDRIFEEADEDSIEESGILAIYQNLLVARSKLTGRSIRGKLEALRALLLENYTMENVVDFFEKSANE